MSKQSSNTWQTVGAALIVGAITGVVWFAVNTPVERPQPATAAAELVRGPAERSADIATLMHVEPAPVEAAPPLPADQVRVCGQIVPRAALAEEQIERTLHEAGAAVALEAFARQQLASDDHARAVGLILRMQADAHYRDPPGSQTACKTDDCWKQSLRDHADRVAPLLTELATLAAAGTDPRVMMLARDQCLQLATGNTPTPHCQALTARRLVALDRDNAAAWLALAAEEPASIDEAMYQASVAPRWDDHAMASRRYIERVDAQGGLSSLAVAQALMAVPATRSIEGQQLVRQHCSAQRVAADANRHQLCAKLADGLHQRSTSVAGLVTAGAVAQTLGSANAQAWQEQAKVFNHVLLTQSLDDEAATRDARDCTVGMPRELLLLSARAGERPALRALMQASGHSDEHWRERMLALEAAQAAGQIAMTSSAAASAPR